MYDLQLVVEAVALDPAADDALGPFRMRLFEPGAMAAEKDQADEAGAVKGADFPRVARAARPLVRFNLHHEGLFLALVSVRRSRQLTPDQALRTEEQHVAHDRAGDLLQHRGHARSDTLQRRDRREQRKEDLWPHRAV